MSIEERPFFKAERIGKQHSSVTSRPVKVVLDSSTALEDLLRKSKELKNTTFKKGKETQNSFTSSYIDDENLIIIGYNEHFSNK